MRNFRIAGAVVVLLAVLLAAAGAIAGAIEKEAGHFTAFALEHALSGYLGRKVTIGGPVDVKLGSPTRLSIGKLQIANTSWGTAPEMATVAHLQVTFYPESLVHGPKNFPLISLSGARLLLERSKTGQRNWSFLDKFLNSGKSSALPILDKVTVDKSEISFHDGRTGATETLAADHAELDAPKPDAPVDASFRGELQGKPLQAAGTVGPLAQLRKPPKPYPVDITGSYAGGGFFVRGTIAKPLGFTGADLQASIDGAALEPPLSSYLGRKVTVAGPVKIHVGSTSRLDLPALTVANAPWGTAPEMLTIGQAEIEFDAKSLIHGPARFSLISLGGVHLLLETAQDGKENWVLPGTGGKGGSKGGARRQVPILNKFVLADSAITFHDGTSGATNHVAIRHAELDAPGPKAPVKFQLAGAVESETLHLGGTVGPLAQLRKPAKPYPVDLDGSLGGSRIRVQGTMAEPLAFSGLHLRVSMVGKGLQKLATAINLPLPPLPDFRATSVLTGGQGRWQFQALSAKLGASDLEGGVGVDLTRKVPYLQAHLTSSFVDLADFTGFLGARPAHSSAPAPQGQAAANPNRLIPATPIAVKRLNDVNADLSFSAGRAANSKGIPLQRVSAALHLENGVLTVKPLDFGVARGTVDLGIRLDATSRTPRMKLDLDIRHVDLHELMAGMKKGAPFVDETAGRVGGFVHFTSAGGSLRDLLGSMDGDAAIFADEGRVSGLLQQVVSLDVLRALGLLLTGDRPTPVNCFVSDFSLRHGIATVRVAVLDTSTTLIVGRGNFNFPSGTIYLDFKPYGKGPSLLTLRSPVHVRGTFAHPSFGIDATQVAEKVALGTVLGLLLPPIGELLPFISLGLSKDNACSRAFSVVQSSAR